MLRREPLLLGLIAVSLLAILSCGDGWTKLSEGEVRQLFAGSSVEGYHELDHYSFKSYYDPSGWFRSVQVHNKDSQRIREGQWRIKKRGDICIHWQDESQEMCRAIVVNKVGQYRKVKGGLFHNVVVTYTRFNYGSH